MTFFFRKLIVATILFLLMLAPTYAQETDITIPPDFVCEDGFGEYLQPRMTLNTIQSVVDVSLFPYNFFQYPTKTANSLETLEEGTLIDEVLMGPACYETYVWWMVRVDEVIGWTPESDISTKTYLLVDGKEDSDRDGITDDVDLCPDQGMVDEIDEFGCPDEIPETATPSSDLPDSDGDGVEDAVDFCPDEGDLDAVDDFGCPILEVTPTELPDTDGDGIADNEDFCPDEGDLDAVDDLGCPLDDIDIETRDTDQDGVFDRIDFCPNQGRLEQVDDFGCPLPLEED